MKHKKLILATIIILFFIFLALGVYCFSLKSVSKDSEEVTFIVEAGSSKIKIADNLKSAGLVRSKYALLVYLFFHSDYNLQAGTYSLNRNMDASDIIKKINSGDVKVDTVNFTFVEGKNVNDLIKLIANKFFYEESDIKKVLNDKDFIKLLMEKYDFLTDEILNDNIYYALEGYLFPDTYEILETSSIEDIIMKMLDNTKAKLSSVDLSNSSYTIHEILSMASIVELEAIKDDDRSRVAQVLYKRLEMGKGLGSDVTTYYAVKKTMGDVLTLNDLKTASPYNTSEMNTSMAGKLPIGPICNPSLSSIKAVLNPSDTEYVYFVANTCTGEIFFNVTGTEHMAKAAELRRICETN